MIIWKNWFQGELKNLKKIGVEVVTADKPEDALEAIYSIVHDQSIVAKSKSNTAGEIGLTEFLRIQGSQCY